MIEIERFDDGRSRLSAADIEAAATALEAKRPEAAKVQAAIAQVQADLATRLNDVRMRRTLQRRSGGAQGHLDAVAGGQSGQGDATG